MMPDISKLLAYLKFLLVRTTLQSVVKKFVRFNHFTRKCIVYKTMFVLSGCLCSKYV